MTYNNFPRGSEWRKWDLQVHTPYSYLNNDFGNDWDNYIQRLFRKAIEHDIWAIGITDYFTIDGYKKLKTEYLKNGEKLNELFNGDEIDRIEKTLVLPNIEFRINRLVDDRRVNFHVIFSDEISTTDIEENFLHELDFVYEGNPQDPDEKWKLKIHNLERLGSRLKEEHVKFQDKSDIYIGMMNAVVSDEQISNLLASKPTFFDKKYLLAVPADEDLSKINWDNQGHQTRKILIQKSDCFFSSNPSTIGWGLGKKHQSTEDYINEFKSLKPSIWGSDAHNFDELFEKNSERLLWIKADLTFNGLFQIKFEPEDRVRIRQQKPEVKRPYFILDKVSFLDGRNIQGFGANPIFLNQNLTSIIGGKSTGKSLLLYHIAKTIDPEQVNQKIEELESAGLSLDYDFEKDPDFDFQVKWKDEGENHLQKDEDQRNRQITYIPQHYLTSLSKRRNLEEKRSLNDFIKDTLLSDPDSKKQEEKTREISAEKLKSISSLINDFFGYFDDIKEQKKILKEKGDKKGIKKYIDELKKEIEKLKKQSKLTDKEKEKLNKLNSEETDLQKTSSSLTSDIETINSFVKKAKLAVQKLESLKNEYGNYLDNNFSTEQFEKHFAFIDKIKKQIEEAGNKLTEKEIGTLTTKKADVVNSLEQVEEKLKPLLASVKQQESLKEKTKQLKEEEGKINQIEILEKFIQEKEKTLDSTFESIISEYEDIYKSYKSYQEALLRSKEELTDIKINVRLTFDEERFSQQVRDNIQKVELRKTFENYRNDDGEFLYDYESFDIHKDFIKKLLKGLIDGQFKLYKNQGHKETFIAILEDYFYLDFSVTYKNDSLEKMSPGKRNLVLLKIIIEKNNQEWPILIDQPEDDLDNRSVYNDLVSFLKEKKKQRQIIIVTHNPNAVVGADAEEVIVANQSGQDTNRDNEKYLFEYVTGSLEHSFDKQEDAPYVLQSMGIREHVCDILEGGEDAFRKREEKYGF